jgi:hypothetical protein
MAKSRSESAPRGAPSFLSLRGVPMKSGRRGNLVKSDCFAKTVKGKRRYGGIRKGERNHAWPGQKLIVRRHCEKRSDEAISRRAA